MASPPFDINDAVPADNGIVSQFPLQERTFRDIVEDWLLINHNVQGRHDTVGFDHQADSAGIAAVTEVWASTSNSNAGELVKRIADTGSVEYVGVPPGLIMWDSFTTPPEGWLLCYGQAVSRTTYARLFARISTTHGTGDGSTTFNLPDLRGRVVAGQDDMGGSSANRLTGLTDGVNGDTFGAAGGLESTVLTEAQLPAHTHTATVTDPGHTHQFTYNLLPLSFDAAQAVSAIQTSGGGTTVTTQSRVTSVTVANSTTGSGAAHNNVQPTIILNAVIKT
jgi:microcystin-dependent protein